MKFDLVGYDGENLLKTLHLKRVAIYNVNILDKSHITFEAEDKFENKIKRYIKNFKANKTKNFFRRFPKFVLLNLGVVLGVFFGTIFFMFASNFTWKITVYGTKELSTNDIIEVLSQNGIKTGKINLQSSEEIETILQNNYDRIAQVSVIRKGTHIIINLSEKLVYEKGEFQPIVAKHSGIISKINVITGTVNVKIGDFVNVGDILVLPFNLDFNNEQIPVNPIAEIYAKMYIVNVKKVAKEETVLVRSGSTKIEYEYFLFNKKIYSGRAKNKFALYECEERFEFLFSLVPMKRKVITYYELCPQIIFHDFSREKDGIIQSAVDEAYNELPEAIEFLDESVESEIIEGSLFVFVNLTINGIIA